MKARDITTIVGAVLYALGAAMKIAPPNPTMYWLATVFEGVGGTLGLGGRALIRPGAATEDDIDRLQRTKVSKPKKTPRK